MGVKSYKVLHQSQFYDFIQISSIFPKDFLKFCQFLESFEAVRPGARLAATDRAGALGISWSFCGDDHHGDDPWMVQRSFGAFHAHGGSQVPNSWMVESGKSPSRNG